MMHRSSWPGRAFWALPLAFAACSSPDKRPDETLVGRAELPDSVVASTGQPAGAASPLQVVAEFRAPQIVGVAVTPGGRIFGVFPRWDYNPVAPIAEISPDGSVKPYPNAAWCTWNDSVRHEPQKHWICPQSAYVDATGMLWVLDPAAPGLKYVVPGGPKLVKIDPGTNQVLQTISFPESVAPRKSYLNDVRIDTNTQTAYITESAQGGIVVVDLGSGQARRLLAGHPSVKAQPGLQLVVDGHAMIDAQGKPMQISSDGIALSRDGQYLYYHALTSHRLYRIKTAALRNAALSEAQLGQQVEDLGETPATDGMEIDAAGNVYLTAFENNALVRRRPSGQLETVAQDARLQWPDTYSFVGDSLLYVTTSAIHKTPSWNKGVSQQEQPFRILRMRRQ